MVLLSRGAVVLVLAGARAPNSSKWDGRAMKTAEFLLRICSIEGNRRAVIKMPVPVSSMPQGARGPSTLDKRMKLPFATCSSG
jgi:hypothetical protein